MASTRVKGIVLDTKVLDRIAKELKPNVQKRIAKSAFRVEGGAKMNSPHKTGAHRNSGYTVAPGVDTYAKGTRAAAELNPDAFVGEKVNPKDDMSAVVGFSMEYSLWTEVGKHGKPHLVPAMESEEKALKDDLKKMIR